MSLLPTQEQFDELIRDARIVLDTSALLAVRDQSGDERKQLLETFETFRDRLWIPYHVWVEYENRRSEFIRKHCFNQTQSSIGAAPGAFGKDYLDDHNMHRRITALFATRRGRAPANQQELDELFAIGEDRYRTKIPPGFADQNSKAGNTLTHNGLTYRAEYGDWLVWAQTLQATRREGITKLIFVTNDRKPDWWRIENGYVRGPRNELLEEMASEGGVTLGWIYNLPHLLGYLRKWFQLGISEKDVRQVAITSDLLLPGFFTNFDFMSSIVPPIQQAGHRALNALRASGLDARQIADFGAPAPQIEVLSHQNKIAVAVMGLRSPMSFLSSYQWQEIRENVQEIEARGYRELWIYACCRPIGFAMDIEADGDARRVFGRSLENVLPIQDLGRFLVKVRFGQFYNSRDFVDIAQLTS